MDTLSVFGGGYLTAYIPDGATAKSASLSGNGVVVNVLEKGVFTFGGSLVGDVEIEIDGVSFSGDFFALLNSLAGSRDSGAISVVIPYSISLKVTISNFTGGNMNINRISL